jgi:hypothetical protein
MRVFAIAGRGLHRSRRSGSAIQQAMLHRDKIGFVLHFWVLAAQRQV